MKLSGPKGSSDRLRGLAVWGPRLVLLHRRSVFAIVQVSRCIVFSSLWGSESDAFGVILGAGWVAFCDQLSCPQLSCWKVMETSENQWNPGGNQRKPGGNWIGSVVPICFSVQGSISSSVCMHVCMYVCMYVCIDLPLVAPITA